MEIFQVVSYACASSTQTQYIVPVLAYPLFIVQSIDMKVNTAKCYLFTFLVTTVTGQWVSEKLAMVTVCTKVLDTNAGFHSSTRALAVTNLCFSDTH